MKNIKIDLTNAIPFINQSDFNKYEKLTAEKNDLLKSKSGKGNEFLGWNNLPNEIPSELISEINLTAEHLKQISEIIVVIGIGGSYLGSKAVIEALSGNFDYLNTNKNNPTILYAGHNLSEDYHYELLNYIKDKTFSVIVISKSGTTTEPSIAFRLLRKEIEEKFGKEQASKRIVAITDSSKGALRELANKEHYKTFDISDDIGGRYSVLTPVGLLPIACAGFNIKDIMLGAKSMLKQSEENPFNSNPTYQYAAIRNAMYLEGKTIEILANSTPRLNFISEWWKQLFGESEGKENKGIFPASASFTTDLHSIGQYIQDGIRNVFETIISVEKTKYNLSIPTDIDNLDKLNYLEGKSIDYVNKMAELGTSIAHSDGQVPNIKISLPELNEFYIGELLYFFEKSCAISGYLLEINPFDQPGVEAYKNNMFSLLGKPGFEEKSALINKRLKKN
jgi:glucose-6-phosphate isomerase